MNTSWQLSVLLLLTACAACANPDRVTFVTASEVGIGADATMGNVNIGYDRNELVVGPVYAETGALPPVYAKLDSDLAVFTPRIQQIYATGEAARLVTDKNRQKAKDEELTGDRKLMVFGTTTNFGLKVHFTGQQPTSFNFGYKRKEFSVLPLREEATSKESTDNQATDKESDKYASVLAGISLRVRTPEFAQTGINASQFIATGDAANNLASNEDVRAIYQGQAETSLGRAAVMGVPLVDLRLQRQASLICRTSLRRTQDASLAAELEQIENELGYTIGDFCVDPTLEKLEAISAKMQERGLM